MTTERWSNSAAKWRRETVVPSLRLLYTVGVRLGWGRVILLASLLTVLPLVIWFQTSSAIKVPVEDYAYHHPGYDQFDPNEYFPEGVVNLPEGASDGLLFTTFFGSKEDPMHHRHFTANTSANKELISYIARWYISVKSLKLSGIVFHDFLPEKFVKEYTTSRIKFQHVSLQRPSLSLNDERFLVYLAFIRMCKSKLPKFFLSTDARDVCFGKNPFQLMGSNSAVDLWVATEAPRGATCKICIPRDWRRFKNMLRCYGRLPPSAAYYSAGVVGGKAAPFIYMLEEVMNDYTTVVGHRYKLGLAYNCDMYVIQRNIAKCKDLGFLVATGGPFHSPHGMHLYFDKPGMCQAGDYYVYHH